MKYLEKALSGYFVIYDEITRSWSKYKLLFRRSVLDGVRRTRMGEFSKRGVFLRVLSHRLFFRSLNALKRPNRGEDAPDDVSARLPVPII